MAAIDRFPFALRLRRPTWLVLGRNNNEERSKSPSFEATINTLNFAVKAAPDRSLIMMDSLRNEGPFDAFRIILASRWFENFFDLVRRESSNALRAKVRFPRAKFRANKRNFGPWDGEKTKTM